MMLWLAIAAFAQEERCSGALRVDTWREAMDEVDAALERSNVAHADRILDDVVDQLRCLDTPADPADLGRLARQIAVVAFYAADEEERISWTWLAHDTVGGAPWPEGLVVPDRFHELALAVPERPMQTLDEVMLAPPKKGGVLLDGRPLARPVARSGVVHLLQVVDKKGHLAHASLQLGADFPESWLVDGTAAVDIDHLPAPPPPLPLPLPDAVAEGPDDTEPAPPEPTPPEPAPTEPPPPESAPEEVAPPQPGPPVARPRVTYSFDEAFPDCPWKASPNKARVEGKVVVVNRQRHSVASRDDVTATQRLFRQCGEFRAARRLGRWSDERRKLLKTGAEHREAMLRVLVQGEPTRAAGRGRGGSTKD